MFHDKGKVIFFFELSKTRSIDSAAALRRLPHKRPYAQIETDTTAMFDRLTTRFLLY